MKVNKIVCAALVVAAGYSAFAAEESIASANVVGYTTASLDANKWYLMGCDFRAVGGTSFSIQDMVINLTPGTDLYDSPNIQYWDGAQLKTLVYIDGAWDEDAADGDGDFVVAWADDDGNASKMVADPGFGCWIKLPEAGSIQCAGEVVELNTYPCVFGTQWSLVGNPYPVSLSFNGGSLDCSSITPGTDLYDSANIQYWDGTQLKTLIYIDGAWDEDAAGGEGDFVVAWTDDDGNATKLTLPPCSGFWIKGAEAGSFNFVK